MLSTRIRKAVFPVAGLGTRSLPPPKPRPKRCCRWWTSRSSSTPWKKPTRPASATWCSSPGRSERAIENHFDTAYELESELERGGQAALLELVRSISPADMNCLFVRQPRSLGLGHAVLCAEPLVGHEPFAVLLADDLMVGENGGPGVMAQMTAAFAKQGRSLLAVQEVPPNTRAATASSKARPQVARCCAWSKSWKSLRPTWRPRAWAWPGATSDAAHF